MKWSVTFVAIQPGGNRKGLVVSAVFEEVAGAVIGVNGSIAYAPVEAAARMTAISIVLISHPDLN